MKDPTQAVADAVRLLMARAARFLNKAFEGKLQPVHITLISFLGHIPAAWALYDGRTLLAAYFITVFGLMDSLDGALAREQNSVSRIGMLLDSVSDRIKEALIYAALAVYVDLYVPEAGAWVVATLAGTSILVSYVRARGEATLASIRSHSYEANKVFVNGVSRYEVRMTLLVIGLVTGLLAPLMHLIIALNLLTAAMRFTQVGDQIKIAEYNESQIKKSDTKQKARKKK